MGYYQILQCLKCHELYKKKEAFLSFLLGDCVGVVLGISQQDVWLGSSAKKKNDNVELLNSKNMLIIKKKIVKVNTL